MDMITIKVPYCGTLTVEATKENMTALCSIATEMICAKHIIEDDEGTWNEDLKNSTCEGLRSLINKIYHELDKRGHYDSVKDMI
jgi:hypothetical protein